ncbi:hypothetical protein [Marinobacter nauticus]|uniref:Uncharacterized protein n=1 Tax=Marinobacter nauticus TaxID=2743 RepID=A0A368UPL4_MARNT|nr:hypothetical protein [Marinobacter nauticus]RBP68622.1 hypothetical protein DET64_11811 [Marinobacter nauticus]RCW29980.1 hypothetical protein DET51_11811 [Marinobacter nauticus]
MINNFKTDLTIRVAATSHNDILTAMGYVRPTTANRKRLQRVLECPDFGLSGGGFDFKYSSHDFLRALCRAVGMEKLVVEQRIAKITTRLEEERRAFKPYIWVDTGFMRKSQPLFALAACDDLRYLRFVEGFWRYSLTDQLGETQSRIRAHVAETGGKLGIWGKIKQYWFYYEKNAAYLFNLRGEVVGKRCGAESVGVVSGRQLGVIKSVVQSAQQ